MGLQPVSLRDNDGIRPLVVGIVTIVLATFAVALRFYAHRNTKQPYALDDVMIVIALVFAYGNTVDIIIGVIYGATGLHTHGGRVTRGQLNVYPKNLIATTLLWASTLSAVKLSLLLLYARLFSIRKVRLTVYCVILLVLGWWLSVLLEELLLCRPIYYSHQNTVDGSCGNVPAAYLAAGILNLLTDFTVLVLPIPIVWSPHLPLRSRIALIAIFCVGLLVCIISIVRIHAVRVYDLDDPTYSMWKIALWNQLEPTLGIMCACVPFMRPIFDLWTDRYRSRQDTNAPLTAQKSNIEAIPMTRRSLENGSFDTLQDSGTTANEVGRVPSADLAGVDAWCEAGSHPASSEGAIRVERLFIVNSGRP